MTLESSKTLGGIGALLMFVGVLPYINTFGIIEVVGLILVLIGLHGLAGYYKEQGIFNNSLYAVIVGIVGGVIAGVVLVSAVLTSLTDFIYKVFPGWNGDWTALSGLTPNTSNISPTDILPFIGAIIAVLAIIWIFSIIVAFLFRRSLRLTSDKTGVGLFSTAGLLLLVGAVLTIILIGFLLIWIAILLIAIAFFSIKPQLEQPPVPTAAYSPPTPV